MRWENLKVDREEAGASLPGFREPAVVRTFEAPEALGTRFYEVRARSALNKVPRTLADAVPLDDQSVSRLQSRLLSYCFARPTHTYLDFNAREDFERQIVVKVNVPELVRTELARASWKGEHVALGTNTDPYQWVEGRYELMPGIWEAMRDYSNPCSVLTKSPLLLRDLELMREITERTEFTANLSIPTLDEKAWRATEPHTPHPRKRIEAVAELKRAGIRTGVLIAPLIPGVNDSPDQVEPLLDLLEEAGADSIGGVAPSPARRSARDLVRLAARAPPGSPTALRGLYERGAYMTGRKREAGSCAAGCAAAVRAAADDRRGTRAAGHVRPPDRRPQPTAGAAASRSSERHRDAQGAERARGAEPERRRVAAERGGDARQGSAEADAEVEEAGEGAECGAPCGPRRPGSPPRARARDRAARRRSPSPPRRRSPSVAPLASAIRDRPSDSTAAAPGGAAKRADPVREIAGE